MEKNFKNIMFTYINKKNISYLIIIILLFFIFIQRSCTSSKVITKKESVIKYDTLTVFKKLPSKIITKYKTLKGDTVYIPGKVDTLEVKVFEKATDSTQLEMYIDATKIRQYKSVFNDSLADISIYTETKGELLKMAPTITIKARLPEKKTVFALYGGFELSNNLQFNNPIVKGNLFIQNKKGDLYTTGYDTNKNIYIGYSFRFINIKK